MKLRTQISASLVLACCASSLLVQVVLFGLEVSTLRAREFERAQAQVDESMWIARQAVVLEDVLMLPSYLETLKAKTPEILQVRIQRAGNWVVVGEPAPAQAGPVLVLSAQIPAAGEAYATAVEISFSRSGIDGKIRAAAALNALKTSGVMLGVVLLSIFIGYLLAGWWMRPLTSIIEFSRRISEGLWDSQVPLQPGWADEMRALGTQLNGMAVKLKELDGMKRDFVSSVTHELRSPLGAIGSISQLLLDPDKSLDDEERSELLKRISANTERLEHLVTNLLQMSRIERGTMEIEPRRMNLAEVARDTVLFLKPRSEEKGLSLSLELAAGELMVFADPNGIQQILINLISNATKFTPSGGKVSVYAVRKSGGVECGVRDTGPGIPPADLERIFRPFERGTGVARVEGAGIGLALSRKLVEIQGGSLEVESEVGKGSRFFFMLPETGGAAALKPRAY